MTTPSSSPPRAAARSTTSSSTGSRGPAASSPSWPTPGASGATAGPIGGVDFRNLDVDFSVGGIGVNAFAATTGVRRLRVQGVRRSTHLSVPLISANPGPVAEIGVRDIAVDDDGISGSSLPQVEVRSGAVVSRFSASGVDFVGHFAGQSMPLLQIDSGGSVALATITNASATNVAGLVANSGTLSTLVLSNTGPATTDYTGTAPGSKKGDYYISTAPATPAALAAGAVTAGSIGTTTASATATDATGGTAPYSYQWYRSTASGTLGSAVSGQTTRSLSDTGLTASTTYYYTLKYTDSATPTAGTVSSNQVSLTTAGTALAAGAVTAGSTGTTTASATATDATGGTAPYSYQWYRSTASGTLGSAVSGQTSRTLADSGLTASTTYFYTLRYTDATAAHVDSTQVTLATSAAGPTTHLDDTFVGAAGSTIAGTTPNHTAYGTVTWSDFTGAGFGAMVMASGGGCQAASYGTAGGAYAGYNLTGSSQDQSASISVVASDTTPTMQVQMHRDSGGTNFLGITASFSGGQVILTQSVSGTPTELGRVNVALSPATPYTFAATTTGGLISISLNGSPLFTNQAIPTGTGNTLLIGQSSGTVGGIKFTEVKVAS